MGRSRDCTRRGPPRASPAVVVLAAWLAFLGAADAARGAIREIPPAWLEDPALGLRHAREALDANDIDLALPILEAMSARHPVIADHAELMWLRALVESGRTEEAIAMMATRDPSRSRLAADFYTLLGRAHAANGSEPGARALWEKALDATEDDSRLATLHLSIAESYERSDEPERAAKSFLAVWTKYPLSRSAVAASDGLDRVEALLGRSVRGSLEYRRRGDAFHRALRNEAALADYDRVLADPKLSAGERHRAGRNRAYTLFRLRRYPEAAEAFGALPVEDELRIEKARAHARAGDEPLGIDQLAAIGKTRSRHAARANLLAGLLAEGEDEHERARAFFVLAARRGAESTYGSAAVWHLGWSAYRADRFEEAIGYFERLIEAPAKGPGPVSSLRPRYWRARALENLGRDGASEEYARIAAAYPLSYYGWRAASRLPEPVALAPPKPLKVGTRAIGEPALERVRILLRAGWTTATRQELDALYPKVAGLEDRLSLAQLYTEIGEYNRPERLMLSAYDERLSALPDPANIEVWWYAWPAPFDEDLDRLTARGIVVERALVYAVMREESGYLPGVVSVSGARGLLQIMPETGKRLAQSLSLSGFTPDDLYVPAINMQLGSRYLDQLLERFGGRASAAIAAYNAGENAVERWIVSGPAEDDEWVESIPYDQTRTYVKRVMRSLYVYRTIR